MADFNLSENLKIHLIWFRCLGLWRNKDSTFLYTFLTIFVSFCTTTFSLSAFMQLCILLDNDLQAFTDLCYMAVTIIIISVKTNYFIKYRETVKDLVKGLQKNKPKLSDKHNQLIENYMTQWNSFFVFMSIVVPINGALFFSITPFFMDAHARNLPMNVWYPYDYKKPIYYETTYVYQSITMLFLAPLHLNIDGCLAKLMAYIAGECIILEDSLANLYELTKKSKRITNGNVYNEMNAMLIDLIKYHKEICEYAEKLEDFYNPFMMVQICIGAPSIAMTMFKFSLMENFFSGEVLLPLVYQVGILFDFFAFCWFGNEVLYQSANLSYAAFKCNWLDAPLYFKKNLLFFIHRSEKPIRFRVFRFFEFSLQTYAAIIRASYSYFALLKQVNNE